MKYSFSRSPSPHGEKDGAADARQKAQAVDDVPHRGHHCQGGGAVGPLVLPHHGHVHDAVDGAGEGAAEGRPQVAEIELPDISGQQVHGFASSLSKSAPGRRKKPDKKTGVSACHLIRLVISSERLAFRVSGGSIACFGGKVKPGRLSTPCPSAGRRGPADAPPTARRPGPGRPGRGGCPGRCGRFRCIRPPSWRPPGAPPGR